MDLEREFRMQCAKDQAMRDLARGAALFELLDTLPTVESEYRYDPSKELSS